MLNIWVMFNIWVDGEALFMMNHSNVEWLKMVESFGEVRKFTFHFIIFQKAIPWISPLIQKFLFHFCLRHSLYVSFRYRRTRHSAANVWDVWDCPWSMLFLVQSRTTVPISQILKSDKNHTGLYLLNGLLVQVVNWCQPLFPLATLILARDRAHSLRFQKRRTSVCIFKLPHLFNSTETSTASNNKFFDTEVCTSRSWPETQAESAYLWPAAWHGCSEVDNVVLLGGGGCCCCLPLRPVAVPKLRRSWLIRQVRGLCGADARLGFQEGGKTCKIQQNQLFSVVYAKKNSEIREISEFGKFAVTLTGGE